MLEGNSSNAETAPIVPAFESKKCSRCAKRKPLVDFRKNPQTRDGRRTECRLCSRRGELGIEVNVLPIAPSKREGPTRKPRPCCKCDRMFTPDGSTFMTCPKCFLTNSSNSINDVAGAGTFRRGGAGSS